jgi:hypothetical protein
MGHPRVAPEIRVTALSAAIDPMFAQVVPPASRSTSAQIMLGGTRTRKGKVVTLVITGTPRNGTANRVNVCGERGFPN